MNVKYVRLTAESAKGYDDILHLLNTSNKSLSLTTIANKTSLKPYRAQYFLEYLITVNRVKTDGDLYFITNDGRNFIDDKYMYVQQFIDAEKEEERNKRHIQTSTTRNIITIVVSVITICSFIYSFYLQIYYPSPSEIKQIKQDINNLKQQLPPPSTSTDTTVLPHSNIDTTLNAQ